MSSTSTVGAVDAAAPDLTVVVVTFRNEDEIAGCLRALRSSLDGVDAEVVVVDNASPDGTVAAARSSGVDFRLVETGGNLGFGRAVNLGARLSNGRSLLLLNPDARVRPTTVRALLEHQARDPAAGLLGGRIVEQDGSPGYASCWGRQTLYSLFCFATGLSTAFPRSVVDPESLGRWPRDSLREVDVVTGLLLLASRSAWETLDGFDEDFWLYGEDADLSFRAWRAGYHPTIVPGAVVEHDGGASSTHLGARRVVQLRARATLLRKHGSRQAAAVGLLLLVMGVALRAPVDESWREAWHRRGTWTRGFPVTAHTTEVVAGPTVGA